MAKILGVKKDKNQERAEASSRFANGLNTHIQNLTQCGKEELYSHLKNISWKQLTFLIIAEYVDFTEF